MLRLRGDYLAIVTLGFGEIIRLLLNNHRRGDRRAAGHHRDRRAAAGSAIALISPRGLLLAAAGARASSSATLVLRLERSILGQGLGGDPRGPGRRARHRHRHDAGRSSPPSAISATIGGLGRRDLRRRSSASSARRASPSGNRCLIVLIIVIGGVGNMLGVIAGAVALIVLPELLRGYAEYRMLVFGLALASLIILRARAGWCRAASGRPG